MTDSNLIVNENKHVVMDNKLIESRQTMPLQAAKIVRMAIARLAYNEKEFQSYSCSITELAEFLKVSKNNIYRDIRHICSILERSFVYIGTDNPKHKWERLQWIDNATYDGNGTLSIKLSNDLKPFLVDLRKCYTQYRLRNILDFDSFYAIRLYEIIICKINLAEHRGEEAFTYSINELRELMFCEKKYILFTDFRRKVIEVSLREINNKSDIYVDAVLHKTGKAYTSIEFTARVNSKLDNRNSPISDIVKKRIAKNQK